MPFLPRRAVLALAAAVLVLPARAADLEVHVGGDKMRKGVLRMAVFANEKEFARFAEPQGTVSAEGEVIVGIFAREQDMTDILSREMVVGPKTRSVVLRFEGLEPGEYGLAMFLDTNGNGILDATITRRILEPWGASRNPPSQDRPLRWEEINFQLPESGLVLDVRLQ